jgi:hypothetical protein
VVDLALFPDFIDGMRQILVQDSTGTTPDQRAKVKCALLLAGACSSTYKASMAMVHL